MTKTSRSFSHSVAWNLAGAGIPLTFAFFAIPSLLAGYGNERFGFLTIIWALIGYLSIFDLGIGRALTKLVSDRLGNGAEADIPDIVRTALTTLSVLGIVASLLLVLTAPFFSRLLQLGPELHQECLHSVRVLAAGMPFVIASAGLIGLLEARARFDSINKIRLIMGVLNFAAPLLMLMWSSSLVPATIALTFSRAATTGLYLAAAVRSEKIDQPRGRFQSSHLNELLEFGGWVTLSNLISPLMAQLDKLVIGGAIALQLLPFYAVPGDLINRLSFVPAAMVGVFFPAFAAYWSAGNHQSLLYLYEKAASVMFVAMLPIAMTIFILAPDAMSVWMGEDFAQKTTPLLRWLCVGFLVNSMARVPHALLQAIGRPSTTAKLHLLELPIYAVSLWWLLEHYGILGAAIAWTARMILDFGLLTLLTCIAVPSTRRKAFHFTMAATAGLALMYASSSISPLWLRLSLCFVITAGGLLYALPSLSRIRHND